MVPHLLSFVVDMSIALLDMHAISASVGGSMAILWREKTINLFEWKDLVNTYVLV